MISIENPSIRAHLATVDSASEKAYASRTLPDEIFSNNMYVHPGRLEELAAIFRQAQTILFCPVQPFAADAYQNLVDIFAVIEQVFIKSDNERHRYFAFLALRWMLKECQSVIWSRRNWNIRISPDREKIVNEEIRDLFREIEDELRYRSLSTQYLLAGAFGNP